MIPGSQKPPKQSPEQHCALLVHAPVIGVQLVAGIEQLPAVQVLVQQPALPMQAPPTGVQGVLHACVAGSQTPRQHCVSVVQAAPSPRQVSLPKRHRFGSAVSSQTSVQQPRPDPEVHVSPVGRQSRLARSIWHCPAWQIFEQQSALAVQDSLSTLHSPPPQRPPKHPSEQQSSAFVQATPSAKQAFVHCRTPACPVTGSHRPLQHCAFSVQLLAVASQAPPMPPPAPITPPCPAVPTMTCPSPTPGAGATPPHDTMTPAANKQIATDPQREPDRLPMRYRVGRARAG
jgi:hypothetical protein